MADLPPYPGMPLWVKVSGIIVIVLALLVVIILVTGIGGPGGHGPGRHTPSGDAGSDIPANADKAARTVEVTTLDTMTFEPSSINVPAGETS